MKRSRLLASVLATGNLRYQTRTMYTTDARLTAFTDLTAFEVTDGAGGIGEVLYFGKSGADYKLVWVDYTTPALLVEADPGGGVPVLVVTNGPAPFNTPYGYITSRLAGARATNDIFTHTADCLIEYTIATMPSTGSVRLRLRKQDQNFWQINVTSAGAMTLFRLWLDNPTQWATSAGPVAQGHRVVLVADGATIKGYSNGVSRWSPTDCTDFATQTGGAIGTLDGSGVISDVIARPRVASGAALAAIEGFG